MNMFYWALIALGAFVAIWFLFVVPAERRHHERKLEILQKKIDQREESKSEGSADRDNANTSRESG